MSRREPPGGKGLVLDGVTVRYGDAVVLDGIDLELERGEIMAVLGPSGSGKSTLLRAVAGLEPLVSGRVLVDGRDLSGVATHRRGLGLMFQDHGLFTHLDVAGNVAYGLELMGMAGPARRDRVAELLDLVGLRDLAARPVDQLSGGEAQRVALARALAPTPGVLMLDEPLGSLDRALREELVGELRRLLTGLGQTALHVTHDQSEAFAMADRVAIIDRGRLAGTGTPAELWTDPGSVFVARFLGHPNIWSVHRGSDDRIMIGDVAIGRPPDDPALAGLGIDPVPAVLPSTAIEPVGHGEVDGGAIEAIVDEVVFDRGHHRVSARLVPPGAPDGFGAMQAVGQPIVFETGRPPVPGGRCRLRVDLGALRLLTG